MELLNGIVDDLEDRIDDEIDEWVDLRIRILNNYPDDDVEALLNMRPGSPRELLELTIDIIGEEPPVVVIETLLHEHGFDDDAIEQLKSADDIYVPNTPLDTIPSYESLRMPDK
jgi:hypothetical protein